ncbi:hypothetical protein [Puia dinghuensis]|uniref:Uncharacterized protein n=1 Tax=Puia dinghuensis TaxID=1792502 RepID=A0A8J2XP75_9BACT|nr:hypothetical protein [Puia dinghuensis]GGA86896.1 hypothetical protein GCM10011511_07470 [Puia dinghuensis]
MNNGLVVVVDLLFLIKFLTHFYLELSNGEDLLAMNFKSMAALRFFKFYSRDENGANKIIKLICNVSYLLAILLFVPMIISQKITPLK